MRKDLIILAALLSSPAFSQTTPAPEDEHVVVTATRNPLPSHELGASVIVLQRAEIEASGAQTIGDILEGLPGISLRRSGGPGSNTEIFIRGDKGGHTMVMVDGVELADASSIEKNFDIGDFPLYDVERIEIVKGPHSVTYGASGLSGVIHIITRRPQAGVQSSVGVEVGSYDTYGAHGRVLGRTGSFGYAASVAERITRGYSTNGSREDGDADGYTRRDGGLRLQYGANEAYSADLQVRATQSVADLDGGPGLDDPNYQLKRQDVTTQLSQKLKYGGIFETRLNASVTQSDRRFLNDPTADDPSLERSHFKGDHRSLDLSEAVQLSPEQSLVASAQWIRESASSTSRYAGVGYEFEGSQGEETISERSYALQHQWTILERIHGQWGVRTLDNSNFGKKSVGQAALNFDLIPDYTTLRFNIGRGFKTPSLYQLRSEYGNPDLKPEDMLSDEAGVEQKFGPALTFTVNGFQNKTDNLIEFDGATSRYYNVNRAVIKGLETTVAWDITDNLKTQAQYTHLSTLDKETNQPLANRPDETFGGDITWKKDGFTWMNAAHGQTRSRGRPYAEGTKGYTVYDSALGLQLGAFRNTLRVGNVFNSSYQQLAGYNTAARNYLLSSEVAF